MGQAEAKGAPLALDVFSDIACPWCFIGKRRLAKALAEEPRDVSITWRAFELQPDLPAEGVEMLPFYAKKFGGEARAKALFAQVSQVAAEEGLRFDFSKMTRAPNTRLAHRAIRIAAESGHQSAVVEACFQGHFEEGVNVSSLDALLDLFRAKAIPLDLDALRARLSRGDALQDVIADEREAGDIGVRGVPFFLADRRVALSGAQSPATFRSFLRSL